MIAFFAPSARRGAARTVGLVLAVATVILPALPLGVVTSQPPLPLGVLWAAYGWAADDDGTWRRPALLFTLGLLHDQMAGGPYGLFAALYLIAFLIGRVFAAIMSAPTLTSIWGGFIATATATSLAAMFIAPIAFGKGASAIQFAQAAAVTALLFPLVRSLYMNTGPTQRALQGARR